MRMTRRNALQSAMAAAITGLVPPAFAAGRNELRIATVAPSGSSFHKRLQTLSAEWSRGPGGVTMNIYAGTQGGELQIVRRMRVGQIQGAALTSVGLAQIDVVGVEGHGVAVAKTQREFDAGLDGHAIAAMQRQVHHMHPKGAGDLRRTVGGIVVDHHDIGVRMLVAQGMQHAADKRRFVAGRYDHHGVVTGVHGSAGPVSPAYQAFAPSSTPRMTGPRCWGWRHKSPCRRCETPGCR